jgi:L-alanine-DL-glutamate epimerase-like enolase superfamily enzyme
MQSDIRVRDIEVTLADEVLRTPLKFGTGLVHAVTSMAVRLVAENSAGHVGEGWGNTLLSDVWGFPSAVLSHEERDAAMREVGRRFAELVAGSGAGGHPIDLFLEAKADLAGIAEDVCEEADLIEPMPILGALVCASPVDAALHDAFGKVNGVSSYDTYGPEFMAHDLSHYLGPEFAGRYLRDYLKPAFEPSMPIFHLVGGMDKLTRAEVADSDPKDGLPVSLEEWIERDGLVCFKVKLRGTDIEWDVQRTAEVADVVAHTHSKLGITSGFWLSTDSNELNESPETVVEYLRELAVLSPLAYRALLYVEQPTERDLSAHCFDMRPVAALKPVLADEGVTDIEKLKLAKELGWSGVGLKVCKCHSSSLLYVAWAKENGMLLSVQDLTNPGLSLVHSAGFASRIDTMMGFEYNSRQYLPRSAPEVREKHGPLFTVKGGRVSTETIGREGLGY